MSYIILGFSVLTGNPGVHLEPKAVYFKEGETRLYSDNGSTYVSAAGWLRKALSDEKFNQFLDQNKILWQFIISRAPWWGAQFQRIFGLVKNALNRVIALGPLRWQQLEEVELDM